MAPEQLRGNPRRASDQYALGIVAYEWLTGERPFQGTPQEVYIQQCTSPPPSLREKAPKLPPDIEKVILRALEKDPDKRFPSVMAFAEALEKACALPGESYYPEDVARAMRDCYYLRMDEVDLGEILEIGPDDAEQLQHRNIIGYRRPFTEGSIYWSERAGAQPIWGIFHEMHTDMGGVKRGLGFPLTYELPAESSPQGTTGVYQHFEGGSLYYSDKYGAYSIQSRIGRCYEHLGATSSLLGFPTSESKFKGIGRSYQCFEGGLICCPLFFHAYAVYGDIGELYQQLGGVDGQLGFPQADGKSVKSSQGTSGAFQSFENGEIYRSKEYDSVAVLGPILEVFKQFSGVEGRFGFPMSSQTPVKDREDMYQQEFEGGVICVVRSKD